MPNNKCIVNNRLSMNYFGFVTVKSIENSLQYLVLFELISSYKILDLLEFLFYKSRKNVL